MILNGIVEIVQASSDNSSSNNAPGFKLIASLLTLGIIAFLAPFLRKEKLVENN